MKQLVKAVLKVMEDCKGIDKGMTVGSGNYSYKGVSDKDVKVKVGESMRKHELIIIPTDIQPSHRIDTWEEEYNGRVKQKQSAFTEVITKYRLIHSSGEEIELAGYGHGVDTQDKAAGKATTYALKYTLLYTFLVATGYIDDADNTHSDEIHQPVKKATVPPQNKDKSWDDMKAVFISKAKKEAENFNKTEVMTRGLANLIEKAQGTYGATGKQVLEALKEAGFNNPSKALANNKQ